MNWTTPELEEFACGMEINMYFPAEDEDPLFVESEDESS
jgi:coenzyme PQQ precursor peptide PqqA